VVALGLNSEYHNGALEPLRQAAGHSAVAFDLASTRVHNYVELAKMLVGRDDARFSPEVEIAEAPEVLTAPLPPACPRAHVRVNVVAPAAPSRAWVNSQVAMANVANARVQASLDRATARLDRAMAAGHLESLQPEFDQIKVQLDQVKFETAVFNQGQREMVRIVNARPRVRVATRVDACVRKSL
jgi:hypothetical protein